MFHCWPSILQGAWRSSSTGRTGPGLARQLSASSKSTAGLATSVNFATSWSAQFIVMKTPSGPWTRSSSIRSARLGLPLVPWAMQRLIVRSKLRRRQLLEDALRRNRFNQRATAAALSLSYDQLRHALKRHKLLDAEAAS